MTAKNLILNKRTNYLIIFLLFSLFILSFLFRYFYIKNYRFQFHFEQARDAVISRKIIENKDLKIQGPPAGNTNETIYHGVFYYYLIGPLYTFSGGNPEAVVISLAMLNSTVIFPIFLILKELSKKDSIGLLAAYMHAFSIEAVQMGVQLFNISLATISIPWLFYFIWKVFFKKQDKYLPFLTLLFGVTHQTGIYLGYLIIPIAIAYFLRARAENKFLLFPLKKFVVNGLLYLALISSIIITQLKLYFAGVFKLENLSAAVHSHLSLFDKIKEIFSLYYEKITNLHLSSSRVLTFSFFSLAFIYLLNKKKVKLQMSYISLWLFSPLLLLTIIPRNTYYMLVGLAPAVFVLVTFFLSLLRPNLQKTLTFVLLIIFTTTNIDIANDQKKTGITSLGVSPHLSQELDLVDLTYQLSNEQDFSISALTSPYGYSTTWAYLYDWYGKKKYGYVPSWFGPDQTNLPGGDLLLNTSDTLSLHFTIYEPFSVGSELKEEFIELQNIYSGKPLSSIDFGRINLEKRVKQQFESDENL